MNSHEICDKCGGDIGLGGSGHKVLCSVRQVGVQNFGGYRDSAKPKDPHPLQPLCGVFEVKMALIDVGKLRVTIEVVE